MISKKLVREFQEEILTWYAANKRDLPWRRTRDPYKILISEVMSQQTQLSRVIPKYNAWLKAFPTVESLAQAKTSEILRLWSGLGYNRRALYLQKAAKEIYRSYRGMWPHDLSALKKLPGVGDYTAGALACFAFDHQVAVVDTNIRKVILVRFAPYAGNGGQKVIQEIADQLLPKGRAYAWNQALMDYAALALKKEKVQQVRQSRFTGSTRYYRGKILRLLLAHKKLSASELHALLRDAHMPASEEWFRKILTNLEQDGLIKGTKDSFQLP